MLIRKCCENFHQKFKMSQLNMIYKVIFIFQNEMCILRNAYVLKSSVLKIKTILTKFHKVWCLENRIVGFYGGRSYRAGMFPSGEFVPCIV